jgi:sugar lactone lactonase YvrE
VCDAGTTLANGKKCGTNMVCYEDSCDACTTGAACTTNPDPCYTGTTVCTSGQPACKDDTELADGASCGASDICCSGTCLDESTDATNCGRCGHSCQGETCSGGVCQPEVLYPAQNSPYSIAVDATNVYFVNNGADHIYQQPKDGSGGGVLLASPEEPMGIAVGEGFVYYTETGKGNVVRVPIGGGTLFTLASGRSFPRYVALCSDCTDNTYVYWTEFDGGNVMKNQRTAAQSAAVTLASGESSPDGIAVDGDYVYWVEQGTTSSNGSVRRNSVNGTPSSVQTLASGRNDPWNLATDGTHVFWTENAAGNVMQVPVGGGAVFTLSTGDDAPYGIAVDSSGIYFSVFGGGRIWQVQVSGTTGTLTANSQTKPWGVALDTDFVYWVNDDGTSGSVNRVAKP